MIKKLAVKLLRHYALKSHNVQTQLLLATVYGLVELFGIGGMVLIIMKARKLTNQKKACNRVTVKPVNSTKAEQ